MTFPRFAIVACLLLVLIGIGAYRAKVANGREAELAAAQATLVRLAAQADALERRLATADAGAAKVERVAPQPPSQFTQPTSPRKAFPKARLPARYVDHPELTKALYVPLVRKHFSRFYASAALSAEQIQAFESLLTEGGPLLEFFLSPGEPSDSMSSTDLEKIARAGEAQAKEVTESVRELLGDAAAQKFEAALPARGAVAVVERVAVQSFYEDSPLTSAQSERLAQLLVEAGAKQNRLKPDLESLDWTSVMLHAPGFLSTVQLRSLEALRAKAAFDREYRQVTGFYAGPTLPVLEP